MNDLERFQRENEQLSRQLTQAIELRDNALGRAALSDRRCVKAVSEILRLREQVAALENEVKQRDDLFEEIIRALSMPPIFWPFASASTWIASSWADLITKFRPRRTPAPGGCS